MSAQRDPATPSKVEWCDKCGTDTEWREHKVGFTSAGNQKYRWRCVPCRARERR